MNELERNPTMVLLLEPSSYYVERVEKKRVVDSDEEDERMDGGEGEGRVEEQEEEEGEVRWRVRDG